MIEQDAIDDWAVMENHYSEPQVTNTTISIKNNNELCMECNERMFLNREGMVCTSCGFAQTNVISEDAEWRSGPSMNGEKTKQTSRVGAPNSNGLFSNQLGTIIKDKYPGYRSRLSKRNLRNINSKDRCLFHAYKHFNQAQYVHRLPSSIVDRAKYIYKGISEKTLTRGDKRKGIMGNCILQSLQENNVPRTTKEVASMFDIDVKDITRMRNTFFEYAGEIIKTAKAEDMASGVILGFNFDLKLRMKVLRRTGNHLEIVKKSKRLSGENTVGDYGSHHLVRAKSHRSAVERRRRG